MKSYAAANKHVYLDYYPAMIDSTGMLKAELSEDDLHPNARREIANCAWHAVQLVRRRARRGACFGRAIEGNDMRA